MTSAGPENKLSPLSIAAHAAPLHINATAPPQTAKNPRRRNTRHYRGKLNRPFSLPPKTFGSKINNYKHSLAQRPTLGYSSPTD
jgi:hypothetical protein